MDVLISISCMHIVQAAVDLLLSFGGDTQSSQTGERVEDVIRRNLPGYDMAKMNKVRLYLAPCL